jgi:hypothetical protein
MQINQNMLPSYTFDMAMTPTLNINKQGTVDCPYRDPDTRECLCLNSCPSDSDALAQDADILALLQRNARSEIARRAAIETHAFQIDSSFAASTIDFPMDALIISTYLGHITQADVSVSSATDNGGSFTLSGVAISARGFLATISDKIADFLTSNGDWDTMLPALGDDNQAPMHKFVNVALYASAVHAAAGSGADCSGDNAVFCEHATLIHTLFSSPDALLTSICPAGSPCLSRTAIMTQLNSATVSMVGAHLSMARHLILKTVLAEGLAGTTPDATLYSTIMTNSAMAASKVMSAPAMVTGSATMNLAEAFPDIVRLLPSTSAVISTPLLTHYPL